MDEDVAMQDGEQSVEVSDQESEYPDPTSDDRTPYPSLPVDTFTSRSTPLYSKTTPTLNPPLTPGAGNTNGSTDHGFSDLSQYFHRGSSNASPNEYHNLEDTFNRTAYTDSPDDPNKRPWTSDFFSRLASAANTDTSNSPSDRGRRVGRPKTRPDGPRRGGWRWAIRGTDHAALFAKPKQSRGSNGKGRPRRPVGRPRGSVNATGLHWIDPGAEFRELMSKATQAWLEKDQYAALEFAKAAVKVNSEVFMAHKMIHDVLEAQGDERGAVAALSVGVTTKRDPELWAELADRLLDLDDRTVDDVEGARSCYVESIKIDQDCYRARVGKLNLHEEMKEWDHARTECKAISRKWPGELDYVYRYAELCIMTKDVFELERAKEAYERGFEYCADHDMLGDHVGEQWTHLNVYLDILLKLGLYQEGIKQLKRLSRWFLGRKDDTFWDEIPDDREFDRTNERRIHLWQFQQGRISRDSSQYGEGLPLQLRVKLGLLRMRLMWREEAIRHFEHLKDVEAKAENYEDMFLEVAESLKNNALFGEALKYYEAVKPLQNTGNQKFWMGIGQCYHALHRRDDAVECYLTASLDEYNIDARVQLARLYESMGQNDKASKMADQVTRLGKIDAIRKHRTPLQQMPPKRLPLLLPKGAPGQPPAEQSPLDGHRAISGSVRSQAQNGDTQGGPGVTQTKSQRVQLAVKKLSTVLHSDDNEAATQSWIKYAGSLYTEFKSTGRFYFNIDSRYSNTSSSRVNSLPQRLIEEMQSIVRRAGREPSEEEDSMPTLTVTEEFGNFCGVPLTECHRIFSELALLYAKCVDQEKCYDVLQDGLVKPNVFRLDSELWNTTQAVRLCCALMFNDSKLMTEVAQEYNSRGKKGTGMAMQLFAATGRLSHGDAYFYGRKTTQWIQKKLRTQEAGIPTACESGQSGKEKGAEGLTNEMRESDGPQHEIDPGLLTVYGHNTFAQSNVNAPPALPYLLRALALQPENLVVNLSIGITYLANAMSKDCKNRHEEIARGQAFFYRYRDLRVASGKAMHLQEAEFNLARMWHQLGLSHLAVPAYGRVLRLSIEVERELSEGDLPDPPNREDFATEAAFALQRIFVAAGNEEAARAITEEWLVL